MLDYAQQWALLQASDSPFAVVVMAHLKALETTQDVLNRKQWKLRLIKMLYQRGYERIDVVRLFRFIDWLLTLPADLNQSFWKDILAYQEDQKMPYMMSFERDALARGREEGLVEGIKSAIELGLELKFGDRGLELAPMLTEGADIEVLKQIKADIRSDRTLEELAAQYTPKTER